MCTPGPHTQPPFNKAVMATRMSESILGTYLLRFTKIPLLDVLWINRWKILWYSREALGLQAVVRGCETMRGG